MRKFALLLTIGLFLSAATANASDGTKTVSKSHKGKKACVCHGKCSKASGAKANATKGACTDPKCTKCGACGKATSEKS